MIFEIINYANIEFNSILTDSKKIHINLLNPIHRITQLDETLLHENLTTEYKCKIEPNLNKFKTNLEEKIKNYLILIADEFELLGLPLGMDLNTSTEVHCSSEFLKIYKTDDFFAISPFSNIINSVQEQFKYFLNIKPFWQHDRKYTHNNSSFHLYPKNDNVSYIKQIMDAITISDINSESNFNRFSKIVDRRKKIPYDISIDVPNSGIYPFYNAGTTFEKVISDIETDLSLHEVLFCIKTNQTFYDKGSASAIDVSNFMK